MAVSFCALALALAVMIVLCEAVHRQGLGLALKWVCERPADFFANIVFLAALTVFFAGICGSLAISCAAVCAVYYLLSCVSFFKFSARNEPLYFSDFLLAFKVMGVAGSSNIVITNHLVLPFFAGAAMFAGVFAFLTPPVLGLPARVIACAASLAVIMPLLSGGKDDIFYYKKGFLRGLALNTVLYFQKVKPVRAEYPAFVKSMEKKEADLKPNVVVVLSESFFDITRIQGLELSAEPLLVFKSLKEKTVSGTLLVTPIGGGTCAVEAEFLTGCLMRHFNLTKPFYYSRINDGTPGLTAFLKERGYAASALHTYKKTFYNRDKAFSAMGFDKFLGLEDITLPRYDGTYVSDGVLTDMIIQEYQNTNGPKFIFGISMENHQPYSAKKYPATEIRVLNGNIPEKLKKEAEAYIHGISHADRELGRLVEFFKKQDEPTVLLFFGDHLGALGAGLDFYRQMGYINGKGVLGANDVLNIYSPDFVIWSNYKEVKERYDYLGANFLSNILLDYIGAEDKPEIFRMLGTVFEKLRCLSRQDVFIGADGSVFNKIPEELAGLEEMYKACEYKNILGI